MANPDTLTSPQRTSSSPVALESTTPSTTELVHPSSQAFADRSGTPAVAHVKMGGPELIAELGQEWRQLCDHGLSDQPFYRPEWIAAYLCAFEPEAKLVLISAEVDGRLAAVLPLLEERTFFCGLPVTKLRGPANDHSVRFDIVRAAGAEGHAAVRAIWRRLSELPGWHLIDMPYVQYGSTVQKMMRTARRDGFPIEFVGSWRSVYVRIPEDADSAQSWMPGRKSEFRSKLRRRLRKLTEHGPIAVRHCGHADPDALSRFYELEASGWKGKKGSAIALNARRKQFYDDVAQAAAGFGYLSLDFLESSGRPVAGHFALNYRGRYFLPKAAYDEEYKQFGPGFLLVDAVLKDHQARGFRELDFVGPWEPDETQWTLEARDHFRGYIFRPSFYGLLLHTTRFKLRRATKLILGRKPKKLIWPPR